MSDRQPPSLSIVMPAYNEQELIERSVLTVHDYLTERNLTHEIIVCSNGSTDQTEAIGKRLMAEHPWFIFSHQEERGVGRAFAAGVRMANAEYIVSLDIDLPAELAFMEYAHDLLKYADMVIGSKSMGNQQRAIVRVLGSQLYIVIAQLAFRLTASDYAPSTKAFRRSAILPVLDHLDQWTGYVFELCLYFRLNGKRVVQIGIDCEDQRPSRFNLLHEGYYRYLHLFRTFLKLRNKNSWFWRKP